MKPSKAMLGIPVLTFFSAALLFLALMPLPLSHGMAPAPVPSKNENPRPRGTVYYVSTEGNDTWSGKLAEPNSSKTDGPFATLTRARNVIREFKTRQPFRKPITVYLRGGTYPLGATLVFLPEDSGTAKNPITYAANPGEKVTLSGARPITGWKKAEGGSSTSQPGAALWTTDLPEVKDGEWYFHQLFVNGQRRQRARSPNMGFYHSDGQFLPGKPTRFKFHPGDVHAGYPAEGDVEIIGLEKWAEFRMPIKRVDPATNMATLTAERQEWGEDKDTRYWVENAADALDAPREWFLDRHTGRLSYLALPGEDMERAPAVAPSLTQLVRFEGTEGTVHDIVLSGLTLAYTDWSMPPSGYVDMQAAFDIPAAVELIGARHCRIEKCTLTHLGQYAVEIHKGSADDQISGCEMTDLGAGGVKVGDPNLPTAAETATHGIMISQNYIHDIGIVYPAAVGVWIGQSDSNTVSHNDIADTYYTAISLGWTWGYGPTAAHHNVIEYNHLYNIGRGVLSDLGCIYSLGIQPGTIERNNLCHDVSRFQYGGWGIYTDEGSSQIVIENNVVYRTQDSGFHQHYGRENVVRNNIFALGKEVQIRRSKKESHLSFTFMHNIVYWKEGKLLDGPWDDDKFEMHDNLYFQAAGLPFEFSKDSWEQWQKRGMDAHSLIADPLFVDPDHGNFALKPGSPAGQIGFQPIDVSQSGRKP